MKYFDFAGSMYAGLNIFPALSIWEKQGKGEGRPDVTQCVAELEIWHPSDKQPEDVWEHGVGAAGAWEGTRWEEGESGKAV